MKHLKLTVTALALVTVLLLGLQPADSIEHSAKKINGISFVAPVRAIEAKEMAPIKKVNANWIAVTPFAFGRAGSPDMRFNVSRQWWGERAEGVSKTIEYAHQLGLKVMVKPHVWVRGHGWAGDFTLETEEQWQQWQSNYRNYIISYARLANTLGVEMFCVGTEFRKATVQRPAFWKKLIEEVRTVYAGKITYAANWDNYENIPFWGDLDYIGIDSYFNLSDRKEPSVSHLKEQWKPIKSKLRAFSEQKNKAILFTEFGYESVDYTTDGHWKYGRGERALNMQAQANAYRAVFETFWDEPWFGGGFLWKWFAQHERRGGLQNDRFTPQNKPAEETIRAWYGRE